MTERQITMLKLVTKSIKLEIPEKDFNVNDIDIKDIVDKYSNDYIIDINNYTMTVLNGHVLISFVLKKKNYE